MASCGVASTAVPCHLLQCRHDDHHGRPGPGLDFGGLPGGGEPPHPPPSGVETLPGAEAMAEAEAEAGGKRTAVQGAAHSRPSPASRAWQGRLGQLERLEPPGVDAASRLLSRCALTGQAGTAAGNDGLVQGSAAPTGRRDSW